MLPWKWLVTSLMLVLPMNVHGDFGLNIAVPNLATNVAASVGQGIAPLVNANGTIQSGTIQDGTGAIAALIETINQIVSPLKTFLESTLEAAGDKNTDSEVIFSNLNALAIQTRQSLDSAITSVSGLENGTKPTLYTQMLGNITELIRNVDSVKASFGPLSAAVDQVKNSMGLITPENVSSIITPDMIDSLVNPLKSISANLNNIASLTIVIVTDKNLADNYQNLFTGSLGVQQQNYDMIYVSSITRLISDANNTIGVLSSSFKTSVEQSYAPLINQQQGSEHDLSNLTTYLASLEKSTKDFSQRTNQSLTTLLNNVNQTLTNQSHIVVDMLFDVVKNLTNLGLTSESVFADQCIQIYGPQFSLSSVSVGRFAQCSQTESSSMAVLVQVVQILLEQARSTATSFASGIQVCQQNTGPCSNMFFSAFPDLTQQSSSQLNNTATVVEQEARVLEYRIRLCALGTTADIGDNIRAIMNKFDSCLQTGF